MPCISSNYWSIIQINYITRRFIYLRFGKSLCKLNSKVDIFITRWVCGNTSISIIYFSRESIACKNFWTRWIKGISSTFTTYTNIILLIISWWVEILRSVLEKLNNFCSFIIRCNISFSSNRFTIYCYTLSYLFTNG